MSTTQSTTNEEYKGPSQFVAATDNAIVWGAIPASAVFTSTVKRLSAGVAKGTKFERWGQILTGVAAVIGAVIGWRKAGAVKQQFDDLKTQRDELLATGVAQQGHIETLQHDVATQRKHAEAELARRVAQHGHGKEHAQKPQGEHGHEKGHAGAHHDAADAAKNHAAAEAARAGHTGDHGHAAAEAARKEHAAATDAQHAVA